jgi:hypothetical protein
MFGSLHFDGGGERLKCHVDQGNRPTNKPTAGGVVNSRQMCLKEPASDEDEFALLWETAAGGSSIER